MFDDNKAPTNLPVGDGPEDMFGSADDAGRTPVSGNDPQSGGVRMKGGDMVDAPSALDAGKIQPKQRNPAPPLTPSAQPQPVPTGDAGVVSAAAQSPGTAGADMAMVQESFVVRHKLLFALVVLMVVVVLALVGFTFFMSDSQRVADRVTDDMQQQPALVPEVVDSQPDSQTPSEIEPEPEVVPEETESIPEESEQDTTPSEDPDGDGLTTTQELLAGTDPQKADTDNDGLTDKEELNIWNTDPLDPDTDDDTFEDGEEVRHGFDPNGPGRLFDVPE